ncbi:MAG: PCP reductase family protein [Candidatus Velamenicoccus archaeovorus]
MGISWDNATQEKFKVLIGKMPVFMRPVAEKTIVQKAEGLVRQDNRSEITEKDMVDAFFAETPFGFQGLMKNDLLSVGIDYTKYGYEK